MNLDKKGNIANESTIVNNEDVDKVIAERWERGQYCYKQYPLVEKDGTEDKKTLLFFKNKEDK